ncbi:MAG: hypothetical protein EHM36_14365 [Deltaproteobacteria bacterium]|nr:MAG: hypothetical protein EHM36_14365 [Deltaproteobacteria bacterium]
MRKNRPISKVQLQSQIRRLLRQWYDGKDPKEDEMAMAQFSLLVVPALKIDYCNLLGNYINRWQDGSPEDLEEPELDQLIGFLTHAEECEKCRNTLQVHFRATHPQWYKVRKHRKANS